MLLDLTDAILLEESECYQLLLWRRETDGVEWKIGFLLSPPKTMGWEKCSFSFGVCLE